MTLRFYSSEGLVAPRLVVHCSPLPTMVPESYQHLNDAQIEGMKRLSDQSSIPVIIQVGESGAVQFALFDIQAPPENEDAISRAVWFTHAYDDLLRLTNPDENLQLVRISDDESDLFFRQRYEGIPVLGSEI